MYDWANGGWRDLDDEVDINHPKNEKKIATFFAYLKKKVYLCGVKCLHKNATY
jgi:hypothetical protein